MNNRNTGCPAAHRKMPADEAFASETQLHDLFAVHQEEGHFKNRISLLNLGGIMLGGQLAALGIKAAWTSASDALPVAAHILFIASPDVERPCDIHVHAIRDGKRLAHRSTAIKQGERLCAQVTTTMARPTIAQSAVDYRHSAPPPKVPLPETLLGRSALLEALPDDETSLQIKLLRGYPFLDIRPVPCEPGLSGRGIFWVRADGAQDLSGIDHYCLLALLTDFWFPLPVHHLPGAADVMGTNFVSTSLDHGLWFHAQPNCGEWILFEMCSTVAGDGLASMQGQAWTADGQRIASFTQIAMLIPIS
jgi:acyl-CoA thioesterase-2